MVGDGARTIVLRRGEAANDDGTAESRVESAVLTIVRLIGGQIAREEFERPEAVKDNTSALQADVDRETR